MDLNKYIAMGRFTEKPKLITNENGTAFCRFKIACNRMKAKDTEQAKADFIQCVAWAGTAKFIANNFDKGDMIAIEGAIRTDSYEDKETKKRIYTTEVVIENAYFTGGRKTVPCNP